MNSAVENVLTLAATLIDIPSVTGNEAAIADYISQWMRARGWPVEELEVEGQRRNVFVAFGTPRIVFSTHMDVVPGPESLFSSKRDSEILYGRGACDAKGILATILVLAEQLRAEGAENFGLLFVVGEETDGIGARTAVPVLKNRGIEVLVNGEPTEGNFARATKGILDFEVQITGKSCHSGYPKQGIDANRALVECAAKLYAGNFGSDPILGESLINIGVVDGGSASNVLAAEARMTCCVRTVTDSNASALAEIKRLTVPHKVTVTRNALPVQLAVPDWEESPYIAAYGTDVPYLQELGCRCYMCGPGTILNAHTDHESLSAAEVAMAYDKYYRLFHFI